MLERSTWVILDHGKKIRTGCLEPERSAAELVLTKYLTERPERPTYYVYFITGMHPGFPVKIGITRSRFPRLQALQTGLPYDLEILAILPTTDPFHERRLHKRFAASRLKGEWFSRSDDLMATIASLSASAEVA